MKAKELGTGKGGARGFITPETDEKSSTNRQSGKKIKIGKTRRRKLLARKHMAGQRLQDRTGQ